MRAPTMLRKKASAHCTAVPVGARIARPFIPDVITTLREGARRVIGATAKPLYAIDGKAVGLDRRSPQTSLFEGGGPPAGGGRSKRSVEGVYEPPDSFSHGCAVPDLRRSACLPPAQRATSSTPSKRELFGRVISLLSDKSRIARPHFVQNLFFAQFFLISYLIRRGQSIPCLFLVGTPAQDEKKLTNRTVPSPLR